MLLSIIGVLAVIFGLICWLGQSLAVLHLPTAVKFGVFEPEKDVDKGMWLIERFSMGIMDILLLWTLPAAGLLMVLQNPYWMIIALISGGIYIYFPGEFILTRIILKKHGLKIGSDSAVKTAYIFGIIWMIFGFIMIYLSVNELLALLR